MAESTDGKRPFSRDVLLWVALLGAGSANLGSVAFTQDRYHGQDAQRDFALRDARIAELKADIERIEQRIERLDADHPPQYLTDLLRDVELRVRALENAVIRSPQ